VHTRISTCDISRAPTATSSPALLRGQSHSYGRRKLSIIQKWKILSVTNSREIWRSGRTQFYSNILARKASWKHASATKEDKYSLESRYRRTDAITPNPYELKTSATDKKLNQSEKRSREVPRYCRSLPGYQKRSEPYFFEIPFILRVQLCQHLISSLFTSGFPSKILYASHSYYMSRPIPFTLI